MGSGLYLMHRPQAASSRAAILAPREAANVDSLAPTTSPDALLGQAVRGRSRAWGRCAVDGALASRPRLQSQILRSQDRTVHFRGPDWLQELERAPMPVSQANTRCSAVLVLLISCAVLLGCSPSEEQVRRDFLEMYPGYSVLSAEPGEGDGGGVYFGIRYRKPKDTVVYQQVWLYQPLGKDGRWQCTQRSEPSTTPPREGE